MKRLFKVFTMLCVLLLAILIATPMFAQTVVTQLPTTCTPGAQYSLQQPGGAYHAYIPGVYTCGPINVLKLTLTQLGNTLTRTGLDYTNATTTPSTFVSFPLQPFKTYSFRCSLIYQGASTAGLSVKINTPTTPSNVLAIARITTAAAGTATFGTITSNGGTFSGAAVGVAATSYPASIEGTVENGANAGNLQIQFASLAAAALTVQRGSFCTVY